MRQEKDFIGTLEIPKNALYGIHSERARQNFPCSQPFNQTWFRAVGTVKLAVYETYRDFYIAVQKKYPQKTIPVKWIDSSILDALITAAQDVAEGRYADHFVVPAISGGAGTSINMNINEIIANAALLNLGHQPGDYKYVDPVEQANVYQSTNDVVPTSLKVATMQLLVQLEQSINDLRAEVENTEKKTRNTLRVAYTQMQEAVPSTYGRLFSTYSEALSRDWWRVSKCFERIKVVNLGGSAVGTGITVPRYFIMEVVKNLQKLTGLPVTRSENLSDATNNLDSFVEVHAILKAHAVNLEKMVSDIRLLASDLIQHKEIVIPKKQAGSSIMPAKVNPVIPEYLVSIAHKVYANDALVASLSAQGCLDLNAYLPAIGHALLESLELLVGANKTLKENLFTGLQVFDKVAYQKLIKSLSVTTALLPLIGYNAATRLAEKMKEKNMDVFQANAELNLLDNEKLKAAINPQNIVKEGFTIKDLF